MSDKTVTMFKEILIQHGDQSIAFLAQSRVNCGNTDDNLFEIVNDYVSGMDEAKQGKLFQLFKSAKAILDPNYQETVKQDEELLKRQRDYHYIISRITPIIQDFYRLFDIHNFTYYIRQQLYTAPPKGLDETVSRGEYNPQQTINPEEYSQVAELALLLRPTFPIISETMLKMKEIAGNEYKEVVTGEIFRDMNTFTHHPGWMKIKSYMAYFYMLNGNNNLKLAIISDDAYVKHAFYSALFERLAVAHVPSKDKTKNLAKSLYSVAKQFTSPTSKVREKNRSSMDDQSNQNSNYEVYFLKEEVSSSDEEAHAEFFTMDLFDNQDRPRYKDRFKHPCMGLEIKNPHLVEWVYDHIPGNWEFSLHQHILRLLQLTFFGKISYNIYYSLDYHQLMAAISLATVKLHEMGYPNLSTLVCSIHNPTGTRSYTDEMFSLDSRDKEMLCDICEIIKGQAKLTTDNEAVIAATEFLKHLGNGQWTSIIEPGMLDRTDHMDNVQQGDLFEIDLSREIKTEFLDLVSTINQ